MGLLGEQYADGIYDERTSQAISAFQQMRGVEVTGEADIYTVIYLNDCEINASRVIDLQMEEALRRMNAIN